MKVEAAMKGAEMVKEVPGHIMSTIQDEIDPETIAMIEQLLSNNKTAEIKIVDNTKRFDILTDTIGQLDRPVHALLTQSEDPIRSFTDKDVDNLKRVAEEFADKFPDNKDVTVYIGDSPNLLESVSDITSNSNSVTDAITKTLSIPGNLITKLTRSSNFDPLTRSVTIFQPSEPTLRHELGHAEVNSKLFNKNPVIDMGSRLVARSLTGLSPDPLTMAEEIMATGTAGKSVLDTDMHTKKRIGRVLGAALGTYGGGLTSGLVNKFVSADTLKNKYPLIDKFLNTSLFDIKDKSGGVYRILPLPIIAGSVLGGIAGHFLGDKITLPGFLPKNEPKKITIIEEDVKEAAMRKIAAAPGFHGKIWNLGGSMLRNAGRAIGTFVNDTSKDAWKNFGNNLWKGHSLPGTTSIRGFGLENGLKQFGNIASQHPLQVAGYGALGAAGLTAAGAAGLYAGHKILS